MGLFSINPSYAFDAFSLEANNKNLNTELKLSKAKNDEMISQNQKTLSEIREIRKYRF